MKLTSTFQVEFGWRLEEGGAISDDFLGIDDGWYWLDSHDHPNGPYDTQAAAELAAGACPVDEHEILGALARAEFEELSKELAADFPFVSEGYFWRPVADVLVLLDLTPHGPELRITRVDDNGSEEAWKIVLTISRPIKIYSTGK